MFATYFDPIGHIPNHGVGHVSNLLREAWFGSRPIGWIWVASIGVCSFDQTGQSALQKVRQSTQLTVYPPPPATVPAPRAKGSARKRASGPPRAPTKRSSVKAKAKVKAGCVLEEALPSSPQSCPPEYRRAPAWSRARGPLLAPPRRGF